MYSSFVVSVVLAGLAIVSGVFGHGVEAGNMRRNLNVKRATASPTATTPAVTLGPGSPQCAQTCLNIKISQKNNLGASKCSATDIACLCASRSFSEAQFNCMGDNCDCDEIDAADESFEALCNKATLTKRNEEASLIKRVPLGSPRGFAEKKSTPAKRQHLKAKAKMEKKTVRKSIFDESY